MKLKFLNYLFLISLVSCNRQESKYVERLHSPIDKKNIRHKTKFDIDEHAIN